MFGTDKNHGNEADAQLIITTYSFFEKKKKKKICEAYDP